MSFGEQARDAIPALQKAEEHDGDARVREAAGIALSRIDPERFPYTPKARAAVTLKKRRSGGRRCRRAASLLAAGLRVGLGLSLPGRGKLPTGLSHETYSDWVHDTQSARRSIFG